MESIVSYHLDNGVATIAMDDGKANVISPQMIVELNRSLDCAEADGAAVLLTGRRRVFSSGFDLNILMGGGEAARTMVSGGWRLTERLLSFPSPVTAACDGHAIALGAFLLLSTDYRVGVSGTFKYATNEVALGLTMPHAALAILGQRLTPAAYTRAALLSETFTPDNAVAAGFVDRIVESSELYAVARASAETFAQLNRSAYLATKLRMRAGLLATLRAGLEADDADNLVLLAGS
jgi:enoyl-CoA hydratase